MKVLLVDDSRLARAELRRLLDAYPDVVVAGEARNADEARALLATQPVDLLLLDIHMPGETGFELLASLEAAPPVVFTTAYDAHALRAFDVNALDYLLKPVQESRLAAALDKVRAQRQADGPGAVLKAEPTAAPALLTGQDQVFVKDGERCWFVRLADVRLFEINGSYTQIYFDQHRPLIPRTLAQLEARLDPKVFFRTNRQQIINLNFVADVEPWFSHSLRLTLRGGAEVVEVSRQQSVRFRELLSL